MNDVHSGQSVANRLNLYQAVHKGLRAMMSDTLLLVGKTDLEDTDNFVHALERVDQLLTICQAHLEHENAFIHPALEARVAGSSAQCTHDHVEHVAEINRLRHQVALLRHADAVDPALAWHQLYQALSVFMAENLTHMLIEENSHMQALWSAYTEEELHGIHSALVASIPPEEMAIHARWMVSYVSHPERVGMFMGMKAEAPPAVYEANLAKARDWLSAADWDRLNRALA